MQVLNRARHVSSTAKAKVAGVIAVAIAAAMTAPAAFAQSTGAIDVSGVVTKIEAQSTPIGLIGMAVLGIVVALVAFVWVRRSIRG